MSIPKTNNFVICGEPVICPHCGGKSFDKREVLLNTRGATFLNLNWLNQGATALTCMKCGRIEWFCELGENQPLDSDQELKRRANEGSLG
jgi:predicted nucleic-acid-binding Zn-ribbon protein